MPIIIVAIIIYVASIKYSENGSLGYLFVKLVGYFIMHWAIIGMAISIIIFLAIIIYERIKVKRGGKQCKKIQINYILIITLLITFIVSGLRPINNDYTSGQGQKMSYFRYLGNILKDCIDKETNVASINKDEIYISRSLSSGGRGRRSYIYRIQYNVMGENNTKYTYSSEESGALVKMVSYLLQLEDEISIEYYINSGVIKSIEGIDKSDKTKIREITEILKDSVKTPIYY